MGSVTPGEEYLDGEWELKCVFEPPVSSLCFPHCLTNTRGYITILSEEILLLTSYHTTLHSPLLSPLLLKLNASLKPSLKTSLWTIFGILFLLILPSK